VRTLFFADTCANGDQSDDEGDDLTDTERHALHQALSASSQSVEAGCVRPGSAILDVLFLEELTALIGIIGHAPEIGRLYLRSPILGTRRTLLKRSRDHLCYLQARIR
jgi:hypothetical protein